MLRVKGRYVEAEAAFRTATRVDPEYAQAWYNLGDLLDDQGRADAAIECLRKALRVAPDYADAMFNLALLLQRKNQYTEARLVDAAADDIRVRRAVNQAEVLRGFAETCYAAKSWDKERRVVAQDRGCDCDQAATLALKAIPRGRRLSSGHKA